MLKNNNHDLVQQLSEISDSLWRMDEYMKNAKECKSCIKMWETVRDNLNKVSDMLVAEIGKHHQEKRFD